MYQSQFIEMFGDSPTKELRDVCIQSGEYGSNTPADTYDGNTRYVRITDINDYGKLNKELVSPRVIEEKYLLTKNDLLFARTGNTVGKTYLHADNQVGIGAYIILAATGKGKRKKCGYKSQLPRYGGVNLLIIIMLSFYYHLCGYIPLHKVTISF